MNILFHILFNYTIISLVFGIDPDSAYVIPVIIFFSIILDLDHLPYIIKNFKSVIRYLHFGSESRTRSHELIGLAISSLVFSFALLISPNKYLVQVALMCLILHYLVDYVIGRTRPLYPYNKTEVFLYFFKTRKTRFILEGLLTIIFGGIFFLSQVQK